ncbi:SIMPL domain-containing protein [Francisella sp. SYW-9]|uniref:SIMPL domain-containing protein n=1 Tax=Francisella sp. SYW-9 TaxID=2610888 RepID=UPI00123CB942|nr:SIMPL domain-containing protein [Francisella sp. SYW-9]
MNKALTKIIVSLILGIGISLSGYFVASSIRHFHDYSKFISVKGLSEKNVTANNAVWTINYSVNSSSIKNLYTELQKSQDIIKDFVTSNGISTTAITYGAINTSKNQNEKTNHYQFNAYGTITIVTNKIDSVKKLSQKTLSMISKGVIITDSNVAYNYTILNTIKPDMLTDAIKNAKIAAENFATNSNVKLGSLKDATQGLFTIKNRDNSYGNSDSQKTIRVVVNAKYLIDE